MKKQSLAVSPLSTISSSFTAESKTLSCLILVVAVAIVDGPIASIFISLILLFLTLYLRVSPLRLLREMRSLFMLLLFVVVMNSFFSGEGEPLFVWSVFRFTTEGLHRGLFIAWRLVALAWLFALLRGATTALELSDGVLFVVWPLKFLRVNVASLSFVVSLAFEAVPFLRAESKEILLSKKARGATGRGLMAGLSILIPIFVSAFRRADEMATAIEARGFVGVFDDRKTHPWRLRDIVSVIISLVITGQAIALRIIGV